MHGNLQYINNLIFLWNNLLRAKEESLFRKMVFFFFNWVQSSCCASHLWPHQARTCFCPPLDISSLDCPKRVHANCTNQNHFKWLGTHVSCYKPLKANSITRKVLPLCCVMFWNIHCWFCTPCSVQCRSLGLSVGVTKEIQLPGSESFVMWVEHNETLFLWNFKSTSREKSQVLWKSTKLMGYKFHKNRLGWLLYSQCSEQGLAHIGTQ